MAKQRASLRGRGAEILFGEPAPVEIEPRPPEPAPEQAESPELEDVDFSAHPPPSREPTLRSLAQPEPPFDEADLERALEEEARVAEPGPEEGQAEPPGLDEDLAHLEEEMMAGDLTAAVAESPMSAPQATLAQLDEGAALHRPPPPEVSDLLSGVVPPRETDIQEPVEIVVPIELPDRQLTEEEKDKILTWLGVERLRELEKTIDEAYREVRLQVGNSEEIATDCYNKLLQARDIVLRGDAARIAQAEYYVELVHARVKRATDSEAAARKYQWPILIWGLFWCGIFLSLLVALNETWFQEVIASYGLGVTWVDMDVFLSAMIWGGVGGVVAVLYSLFKHVGRRDFDIHYNLSYIGKPFLGLVLGATAYMLFNLVLRTLGLLPIGLGDAQQVAGPTVAPGVMYLMAWASGFKENQIFDLIDRAMKRIFSGPDAS